MQWHSFTVTYKDYGAMLMQGAATIKLVSDLMLNPALMMGMNNPEFGVFMSGDRENFINTIWFTEPAYRTLQAFADANGATPSGSPPAPDLEAGLRGRRGTGTSAKTSA